MSKHNRNQGGVAEMEPEVAQVTFAETPVAGNRTVLFHSPHPRTGPASRVSYTIPGVSGNVVIFLSMFKDGVAPKSITFDCELAEPVIKADSTAKAEAAAAKAVERAAKAQARVDAASAKATERAAKAQAALDAAKAKLAPKTEDGAQA